MKICIHCGHHFAEPSNRYNKRWSDSDDSEQFCPNCGSEDVEEAEQCEICGDWHAVDYLHCGVCEKCCERDDQREAYAYGADRKERVELNGVLAYAYSAQEIEAVLWKDLMSSRPSLVKEYANKYITDDIGDFAEWLNERRKRNG